MVEIIKVSPAASVYGGDGKCKGMLTPKRLQIFNQKYNEANLARRAQSFSAMSAHHHRALSLEMPLNQMARNFAGAIARVWRICS